MAFYGVKVSTTIYTLLRASVSGFDIYGHEARPELWRLGLIGRSSTEYTNTREPMHIIAMDIHDNKS